MNEESKNDASAEGQPNEKTLMEITITKEGVINVYTPLLQDKTACYGILEVAKELICQAHKKSESKIVKPEHRIIDFLRNKR